MTTNKMTTYRIVFEIKQGERLPADAKIFCNTEDGLLCEQQFQVLRAPNRVRKGEVTTGTHYHKVTRAEYDKIMSAAELIS